MDKKEYRKPGMYVEEFVPQRYIAACAPDENYVTYEFWCDAGNGTSFNVFLDYNNNGEFDNTDYNNGWIGNFHACRQTHSVTVRKGESIDNIFPKGFIGRNEWNGWTLEYVTRPVRIWRGKNNDDIHCTFTLNESEFTVKNPS